MLENTSNQFKACIDTQGGAPRMLNTLERDAVGFPCTRLGGRLMALRAWYFTRVVRRKSSVPRAAFKAMRSLRSNDCGSMSMSTRPGWQPMSRVFNSKPVPHEVNQLDSPACWLQGNAARWRRCGGSSSMHLERCSRSVSSCI